MTFENTEVLGFLGDEAGKGSGGATTTFGGGGGGTGRRTKEAVERL